MRKIIYGGKFKKDVKLMISRGLDIERLLSVIADLATGIKLADRFHDHPLQGNRKGTRDCHVEPDWVLIYAITDDRLLLIRTGTHADLFGK